MVFFPNKSTHEMEVLKICKVGPWCMWILSFRYRVIPSEIERVMRQMFSSTTCMLALTSSQMTSDGRCIIKASGMKAIEAEDSDDNMDGEDWLDMSILQPRKEGEINRAAVENGTVYNITTTIVNDDELMSMNTERCREARQGDMSFYDEDIEMMEEDDPDKGPAGIEALGQKASQANDTQDVPPPASTQAPRRDQTGGRDCMSSRQPQPPITGSGVSHALGGNIRKGAGENKSKRGKRRSRVGVQRTFELNCGLWGIRIVIHLIILKVY
jgi:hypothetical protein